MIEISKNTMPKQKHPKRILMILENGSFPQDTRVYLEAIALHDAGYHVSVICPTGKSRLKFELVEGVHVYRYPCPPEFNGVLGYLFEYSYSLVMAFIFSCWVLFRSGFDAIHVHCPPDLNSMLAIFFKAFGKKFVVDLHDLSPELFQAQKGGNASRLLVKGLRFFERLASRNADRLIATNQSQNAVQIERCGADPRRCYVVRNGPNELFNPEIQPLDEYRIPAKIIIGYVGLMGVQDGVDYLIRALAKVREKQTNFLAIVIGRGPALESLKKLTEELGLTEHVLFTGYVPFENVPRYIASFDICATPDPSNSYNDSCTTIKTMEYMAIGRPTVAFRTKENEITAGESGFYAENNSVDEFAELIVKLANDPELRIRMGKLGRERVEKSLGWSHQRKVLIQLYDDLFAGRLNHDSQPHVPENASALHNLPARFFFNGALDDLLRRSLATDMANARLSTAFRIYYRIRPFMPTGLRKLFQRNRNMRLPSESQWYFPPTLEKYFDTQEKPLESAWPKNADFALVLTHDVETQQGCSLIPQLCEIEESLGFRSSWNFVPYKYKIDDGLVDSLRRSGHEIAIHGYNHDGRLFQSKEIFDSRVPMINQAIERYRAVGFRAPMVHRNLAWMQQLNIEYDASCFDIDPYQAMPGGVQGIWPFAVGKFVELPYTMPQDHTLFVSLGESTDRVWRNKLQFIQRHHGMALMLTHPDYLDSPARLAIYRDFLLWLRDHSMYWHVLPREVATWFRNRTVT
jgi:glycosyltransferase involved in cell wall biosynthesis/peptidoglycan/xylan/chitin deacetylase (PgdA/CDA1 family)